MYQKTIVVGRLTADPELRYTAQGKAVANFTVAVNNRKDKVFYMDCVVWEKTAENCAQYLNKGSMALVEGVLEKRTWDSDKGKGHKTELTGYQVKFLSTKAEKKEAVEPQGQESIPGEVTDVEPF